MCTLGEHKARIKKICGRRIGQDRGIIDVSRAAEAVYEWSG